MPGRDRQTNGADRVKPGLKALSNRSDQPASSSLDCDNPPSLIAIPVTAEQRVIWWRPALICLVVSVFVLRARYFGNPAIDPDEQFYLLVGDRMLAGAIPYVDIWDRKPPGLFLLYAGIRLLGGAGIIQYQLVASAACAATALVVAAIGRKIASPRAALVSAFAYAPALAMSGGAGGQAPVFFNLPIALAALLITKIIWTPPSPRNIRRLAVLGMGLAGIAVQIKYTAVFEGGFFALVFAMLAWRADPRWLPRLAELMLWLVILMTPTALAWLWYAVHGYGDAFVFANFTSILMRGTYRHAAGDLAAIAIRLSPFLLAIAMGEWLLAPFRRIDRVARERRATAIFVSSWLAVAIAAFLAFGTFFNHYALPLLVPLAIAAAPTFTVGFRRAGPVFAAVLLLAVYIPYPFEAARIERRNGGAVFVNHLTALITARLGGGCLFVFYGEPILYHTTHSCLPTKWPFPYHLSLTRESSALGTDSLREIDRIMASRPTIVVDSEVDDDEIDDRAQSLVRSWLRRRYRLIERVRLPHSATNVWQLRS